MALHTAVFFVILGMVVIGYAWRDREADLGQCMMMSATFLLVKNRSNAAASAPVKDV